MWSVHVGTLRAGRAVRIGKAMRVVAVVSEGVRVVVAGGGGGEGASRGIVEAPPRPQMRHGVILGDEAPTRHGLRDLLLRTTKMGL
jgi:hypothetical protein